MFPFPTQQQKTLLMCICNPMPTLNETLSFARQQLLSNVRWTHSQQSALRKMIVSMRADRKGCEHPQEIKYTEVGELKICDNCNYPLLKEVHPCTRYEVAPDGFISIECNNCNLYPDLHYMCQTFNEPENIEPSIHGEVYDIMKCATDACVTCGIPRSSHRKSGKPCIQFMNNNGRCRNCSYEHHEHRNMLITMMTPGSNSLV